MVKIFSLFCGLVTQFCECLRQKQTSTFSRFHTNDKFILFLTLCETFESRMFLKLSNRILNFVTFHNNQGQQTINNGKKIFRLSRYFQAKHFKAKKLNNEQNSLQKELQFILTLTQAKLGMRLILIIMNTVFGKKKISFFFLPF